MADTTHSMWRKSSYSSDNGVCVELAALPDGTVGVRDSKNPHGRTLTITRAQLRVWLDAVRAGQLA